MESLPKQFYYKKNRLQQLKGFYYTCQTGSVSKGADLMGLNQSTVSLQIQTLERDLNTKLFSRQKKKLQLTQDGEIFYELIIPLLQGIDGVYEKFLLEKKKYKLHKIDIAAHHIGISYLLPSYIKKYTEKHPDVKITVRNITRPEAIDRLKKEEIDMMLYPIVETPQEFQWRKSFDYKPVLLMRRDHPLAKGAELTLEEIGKYPIVRLDHSMITLPLFEEVCKQYGWKSNVEFEQGNWEILKHFVKAGLGLAIVSTLCVDKNDPVLVARSLSKFFPNMSYGIMIKKGKHINDTLRNFIDMLDPNFFHSEESTSDV